MAKRPPKRNATRREVPPTAVLDVPTLRQDAWCRAALDGGLPLDQVRAAYRSRHSVIDDPVVRVGEIAAELLQLDARRGELLTERAHRVREAREAGVPWHRLADAAGVSRPSLIESVRLRQ